MARRRAHVRRVGCVLDPLPDPDQELALSSAGSGVAQHAGSVLLAEQHDRIGRDDTAVSVAAVAAAVAEDRLGQLDVNTNCRDEDEAGNK